MGYQPKYAPKKKRKAPSLLFALLGIVVIPLSLVLTWGLLTRMYQNVGRPKTAEQAGIADMTILEQFDAFIAGKVSAATSALLSQEVSGDVPEETTAAVREIYWIEEDAQVAPEPNQDCYGQTDDPTTLQWLLDEAAYLLDGQELYFSTDVELFAGSQVTYYLDDSIFAITWKEVHDGSVYTFSEIKVGHPSQFRRYLAGGEYGSEMQYLTTEMAASVNAVVASSGDFYRQRPSFGAVVYDGVARRVDGTYAETCCIDVNGDLHFIYAGEILTMEALQAYVDENEISFSLAFGPVLVDNYELVEHTWYGVGEINEGYARAALCQMGELHYIVAAANTEGAYQDIPTVKTFSQYIYATGCKMAYCLDGGQTAAIVMNNELMNRPVYGEQRRISDIIYFATAVPDGG